MSADGADVADEWDVDDLLLLGEPFAVEFANTDHRTPDMDYDVLAHPAAAALWLRHAPSATDLPTSSSIPSTVMAQLRAVRDATRHLLTLAADGTPELGDAAAVGVLNEHAARAPAHVVLGSGADGPTWWLDHHGAADDALVAMTATRCILFLGGDDLGRVRRCARPACPMLFVQLHRARRFCHESCSHSMRQSRYYRSSRAARPT